jgi:hypothetical protein
MPPRLRSIRLQIGSQPSRLVIFAANRFEPSGIPMKSATYSNLKPAGCSDAMSATFGNALWVLG